MNNDFLLLIIKNLDILTQQIQTKLQETLILNMINSSDTFYFDTPSILEVQWMIGFSKLKVQKSVFNITEGTKTIRTEMRGY